MYDRAASSNSSIPQVYLHLLCLDWLSRAQYPWPLRKYVVSSNGLDTVQQGMIYLIIIMNKHSFQKHASGQERYTLITSKLTGIFLEKYIFTKNWWNQSLLFPDPYMPRAPLQKIHPDLSCLWIKLNYHKLWKRNEETSNLNSWKGFSFLSFLEIEFMRNVLPMVAYICLFTLNHFYFKYFVNFVFERS